MEKLFKKSISRSLDAKGRLMLPPEYRDGLANGSEQGTCWITCSNGRLVAKLPQDWDAFVETLNGIRNPTRQIIQYRAKVIGSAEELAPDPQGRIRIPQHLIQAAGLGKDVMLLGMYDKFEIWDLETFNSIDTDDVSQDLVDRGVNLDI